MEALRKPLAVIIALIAAVVLFHFVFAPFYPDSVEVGDIWFILNWFMAFGIIVALIATFIAKRNAGEDCDTNTYICVSVGFYVTAALALLFFWNWFDDLTAGEDGQGQTHRFFWVVINTVFIPLIGSVSLRLWNDSPGE